MQKRNYSFVLYTAAISFILFLLLFVIHFWSFNETFYKYEHRSLKLYNQSINEYIGITNEQLDDLTSYTLDYLKDFNTSLDKQMIIKGNLREVFTNDEKAHMVDVQRLSIYSRYICIVSFIVYLISLFIIYKNHLFNELYITQIKIYKGLGIFLIVLISWILIDFDSFWNFFHHIFFIGNDLWILDLRSDILIMIVPPEFFFHLVGIIVISFILLLGIYLVILNILRKGYND